MENKKPKITMTLEFWDAYMIDKGFKRHYGHSTEWRFEKPRFGQVCNFYKRGDFVVGFSFNDLAQFNFIFVYRPESSNYVEVMCPSSNLSDGLDVLNLIDACSNPSLLPLCIHTKWAHKLVESCLQTLLPVS